MTGLAKGLPIILIIKQSQIASMRNNMVNNSSRSQASMLLTFSAQRMDGQKNSSSINPRTLCV
jgi:hypothetical protein